MPRLKSKIGNDSGPDIYLLLQCQNLEDSLTLSEAHWAYHRELFQYCSFEEVGRRMSLSNIKITYKADAIANSCTLSYLVLMSTWQASCLRYILPLDASYRLSATFVNGLRGRVYRLIFAECVLLLIACVLFVHTSVLLHDREPGLCA